jgi:hypothetical protein
MNRESEARLLEFCVRQQQDFEPAAWAAFDAVSREELACAALFLAGVDWYGREEELARAAERLAPGSRGHAAGLMRDASFDCGRFSNMLRRELNHAAAPS